MQTAIPCTVMRGGTSRGLYFRAADLPAEPARRDALLAAAMGSPGTRQADGLGGGHPLTSKVAVLEPSQRDDADVDYLFLQVNVDNGAVSDSQNCGNILAGVGPYALEQGWLPIAGESTDVRIFMVNSGSLAVARVQTPGGAVSYAGDARIDGVAGTAAPVMIEFCDTAGASCGALFPSGSARDEIDGVAVSCIDNGMPVVVIAAADLGRRGDESPAALEADTDLTKTLESIRLQAGPMMNLGDVSEKTVPKLCLVSAPRDGGTIATRSFIPQRVHESIGVLGAVSVATACLTPGTVASDLAVLHVSNGHSLVSIEHPGGRFDVELETDGAGNVTRAAVLRTARKLMSGEVYVPHAIGSGR